MGELSLVVINVVLFSVAGALSASFFICRACCVYVGARVVYLIRRGQALPSHFAALVIGFRCSGFKSGLPLVGFGLSVVHVTTSFVCASDS